MTIHLFKSGTWQQFHTCHYVHSHLKVETQICHVLYNCTPSHRKTHSIYTLTSKTYLKPHNHDNIGLMIPAKCSSASLSLLYINLSPVF